jgi:hypothetical protein
MGGRQTAFAVAVAITLLSSTHVLALRAPWTPDDVRKAVQRSELVVRGVIASIDTTMAPQYGKLYPSTLLHLEVSEVVKGKWDKRELDVVLGGMNAGAGYAEVTYDYRPGEDVILCLMFDPKLRGGTFRFWVDEQCFVNRNGTWMTRGRFGEQISLDFVRKAVQQTTPEAMARDADAVLVGTIRSVELRTFNHDGTSMAGDDGSHTKATADYVRVLATDGLKGVSPGDSILVRVLRRGTNIDWYEPVPTLSEGKSYLMFLKKDAVGYYPFRGFNGFLEVRGNDLILDDKLRYSQSLPQVTDTIRQALKP